MISILTIDSDNEFTQLLSIYLQSEGGFVLGVAQDGESGYQMLADQGFDLLLLESELQEVSGFEVLRTIRRSGDDIPVIMFSARGENLQRYNIMEYHPDLFLPKSIRLPELAQNLRRLHQAHESMRMTAEPAKISLRQLQLDSARLCAEFQGRHLDLNVTEFTILEQLARRPEKAHSFDTLASNTLRAGLETQPGSLEREIYNLGKKLGPGADGKPLLRRQPDDKYMLGL